MTLFLYWAEQLLVALVLLLYAFSLLWIFIFCLYQGRLAWAAKAAAKPEKTPLANTELPKVTIQLPLYNEPYVVARLLEAVMQLSYPKDKLEVQVLDDSSGAALKTTQNLVAHYQEKGCPIRLLQRSNRKGFKAGALKHGLQQAEGELIAIFDADFIPQKDWLLQTVPHFTSKEIGLVQTRWGHLNRKQSILTKVMGFALDIHFLMEQKGRYAQQHLMAFNGTAGIWRKRCILDAGNWESDTLAEDLDLSVRAQMKGWKFKFLENVVTPAELPVTIAALRSQQFRWNKGGAENFQKLFGKIVQSKQLTKKQKRYASFHLLGSSMHLPILALVLLSVPVTVIQHHFPEFRSFFKVLSIFFVSTFLLFFMYWPVYRNKRPFQPKQLLDYTLHFIQFYAIIMGFSAYNAKAVWLGHRRAHSPFIRTPKFNLNTKTPQQHAYIHPLPLRELRVEILLTAYIIAGLLYCLSQWSLSNLNMLPLLLMALWGLLVHIYLARNPEKAL